MPKGGVANRSVKALNVLPGQTKVGDKRFKYATFQQLINRVDISREVYRDTSKPLLVPADGAESFFQQYLSEWSELDLTADFKEFLAEVYPLCQSLGQLLHYRKKVVRALLGQLEKPGCTAYIALLDLLTHLARDLRDEFWPFFPDAVRAVTAVLDSAPDELVGATADAELFTSAFKALAYLFKYLLRQLLAEQDKILPIYKPLLGHAKEHVRNFAAESLAFLVRKIVQRHTNGKKDGGELDAMLGSIFEFCTPPAADSEAESSGQEEEKDWDALQAGVAMTLFESIKGVGNRLHSNGEMLILRLLKQCSPAVAGTEGSVSAEGMACRRDVTGKVMHRLCEHIRTEMAEAVWSTVHAEIEEAAAAWHSSDPATEWIDGERRLELLLQVLKEWTQRRLARTRVREEEPEEEPDDESEEEGQGYYKVKNKWADRQRKPIKLKPAVVSYDPCEEAERVWDSLQCVLRPDGPSREMPAQLGSSALEATVAMLNVIRRFGDDQEEARKRCLAEMSDDGVLHAVLAGTGNGTEAIVPRSVSYPFVLQLIQWDHFELVAPAVFHATLAHIGAECKGDGGIEALSFFVSVSAHCPDELRQESGRIQVASSMIDIALRFLQEWQNEAEQSSRAWLGLRVLQLAHPPKTKAVVSVVEKFQAQLIDQSPVEIVAPGEFGSTVTDSIRMLRAKCLQTLAGLFRDLQPKKLHDLLGKAAAAFAEAESMSVCPSTLEAVVDCVESVTKVDSKKKDNPVEIHFERVMHSLASPLAAVRFQAARLLRAIEELSNGQDTSDYEVLNRMVSVYETELNFQNSRELTMEIQRVGHTTKLNKLGARCRKTVAYFFVGVLKTKLSSMWTPATEALIEEAGAQFDDVWPLLHAEAREVQAREGGAGFMLRHKIDERLAAEEEASDMQVVVDQHEQTVDEQWAVQCRNDLTAEFLAARSSEPTCTDYTAYHKTLWGVLENAHPLVERKNRVLVDFYLEFLEQYRRMWEDHDDENDVDDQKEDENDDTVEGDQASTADQANMVGVSKKLMNAALCDYLKLFATFQNPRSLKSAEQVRESYESLLTKAEPEIQQLALDCLLTFKDNKLGQYRETLSGIIDEKTFRSTLAAFKLADEDVVKRRQGEVELKVVVVRKEDRPRLVPVLVRILYGKLLNRKGRRHAQQSLSVRRATVMGFMSGLRSDELVYLFDVLLEPYKHYIRTMSEEPNTSEDMSHDKICARSNELLQVVPQTRRTGVLKMLTDVVRQLATLVGPNLPSILRVQLGICQAAQHDLKQSSDDPKQASQRGRVVELRNLALKQIASIFDLFPNFDYSTYITEFMVTVHPLITVLPTEGMQAQHATPILQTLHAFTSHPVVLRVAMSPSETCKGPTRKEMVHAMESLIACLDTPKIADTVLDTVLVCLLNILVEDADSGTVHSTPFLSSLLERLRDRISRVVGTGTEKDAKKGRSVVDTTLLTIISQLTKMTKDSTQLTAIGRMFLPFVKAKGLLAHEELMSVLTLFHDLVPQLQEPSYFAAQFARVMYTLQSKPARLALLQVYTRLAESDETLKECVQLLNDVNAYDDGRLGEYNYELRQAAYGRILDNSFDIGQLSMAQVLPLVYTFFHDIEDVDMSIRQSGASAIAEAVRSFKDVANKEEGGNLIRAYIVPMLKIGLRKEDELVRDEFVRLLGAVVRIVPDMFPDLLALTNDKDPEVDVLNNIVHIQMHRRIKALVRLKAIVQAGTLTPGSMTGFLVPMLTHYVYTKSVVITKGGTRGGKDVVKQGGHNIVTGAIEVIGCMCNKLPWGKYNRVLMQFLRTISVKPVYTKPLIRLVCAIIDNFHFGKSGDVAALVPDEAPVPMDEDSDEDDEGTTNANADGSKMSAENRLSVDKTLADRILPEVYRHLSEGDGTGSHSQKDRETDGKGVRHPIALAIVKLLQVLPATLLQAQLPRLINVLANSLKSHMQSIRDESRKTLVHVITSLGPHYLYFAMEEMKGILLRGYQRHVLAYTTHALLAALAPVVPIGSLDHCFDSVLPVLQDEIVGALSHEKEVDQLMKKTREYKVGKAYDSFKLLAQKVSFSNLPQLLEPVRSVLAATTSLKTLQKVEEVLKRIAQGLLMNEGITPTSVLTFCHKTIMQQQELGERKNELAVAKKRAYSEASGVVDDANRDIAEDSEMERQNAHYLTEFALGLLHVQVKRDGDGFKLRDPETVLLIEPFVPQLLACLKTRENKVLELSLKVIGLLVPCQLPAMAECAKALARRSFKVLGDAGDATGLSQACYRCIAIILRDLPAADVTDHQLKVLLKFISTELDGAGQRGEQSTSFVLLKAIVSRKLVTTEVYDAMDACFKLLIRSQSPSTRTNCSQLLLQFLLEYPLGPKRLQRHLDFIVKNLGYSLESGREAAMGMLNAIIVKFPKQVLLDQIDAIFLAVVARLVSDDSARCRTGAATLLQSILKRTLAERKSLFEQLVGYSFQWYKNAEKPDVQRVAAQLVGLVVEVEGEACEKRLTKWLPEMVEVLEDGAEAIGDVEGATSAGEGWRFLYYTLRSLEKLATALPGVLDGSVNGKGIRELIPRLWRAVTGLLRHPHTWVKMLASRLVGALFARCNPPDVEMVPAVDDRAACVALKLQGCGESLALRQVEEGLWTQLRSTHLDEKLAEQAVKDLLFVARAYHVEAVAASESGTAAVGEGPAMPPGSGGVEEQGSDDEEDADDEEGVAALLGHGDRSEFGRLFARFGRLSRATHRLSNGTGGKNGVDSTREGDWICPHCQNHNYASRDACGRCRKEKGQAKGITTQEAAEAAVVAAELVETQAASKEVENLRRLCCLRWMAAASKLAADGPQGLAQQPHRAEQVIQSVFHLLPQGNDGAGASAAQAAGAPQQPPPQPPPPPPQQLTRLELRCARPCVRLSVATGRCCCCCCCCSRFSHFFLAMAAALFHQQACPRPECLQSSQH